MSINFTHWKTLIYVIPDHMYLDDGLGMLGYVQRAGMTVVKVDTEANPHVVPYILPLTCTSVVGSVIGLRRWVLTPYQLYKAIGGDKK